LTSFSRKKTSETMRHHLPFLIALLALSAFSCKPSEEMVQKVKQAEDNLEQCRKDARRAEQRYESRIADLEAQANQAKDRAQQAMAENSRLKNKLTETQAALESTTREMQASSDDYGVWFRVQIGAYEDPKITEELETNEEGMGLETSDNLQKIVLGRFREYEKAKQLQEQIKTLGIKDAWIASYEDGQRVPIEQVKGGQ